MNILVVGGAGYIGSHVCQAFLAKGHRVFVYDNLSTGLKSNIFPESQFLEADILDKKSLSEICTNNQFDGLVHLAALKAAGESMVEPEKYAEHNLIGTINLLNVTQETGINNFVFSSSAAVYGEPRYLPVDETHPTVPVNFYGYTKLGIEHLLEWYGHLKGLKYAALRYFNAAGYAPDGSLIGLEKNPQNLLPIVMEVACGIRDKLSIFGDDYNTPDGTCIRDYIHVSDLASAHVIAMEKLHNGGESMVLNLGAEGKASVLEVLNMAKTVSGIDIPYDMSSRREGDTEQLYASCLRAKTALGWQAQHSDLKTMVESTWNVYQANGKGTRI